MVVLGILAGLAVAGFFLTRAAASANGGMHRRDAAAWFEQAMRHPDGDAGTVVTALRRAVTSDPDNHRYRLALAGALFAGGQVDEARRVLQALREASPEDADVNLQLARLEARSAPIESRRYYQSALAALWRPEERESRRRVRIELVEFLLAHGERARALSELLVMAADLPDSPDAHGQAAAMFLRAGDPQRALTHFTRVLRDEPRRAEALAGAGAAAFELGDFAGARRYLASAPPGDARTATLLELTKLVLASDPLAPRLRASERRRRVTVALEQAGTTLHACLAAGPAVSAPELQQLQAEAAAFVAGSAAAARRDPGDFVDDGIELAYRIESAVDGRCRELAAPLDQAILLIGRHRGIDRS
jgi:Flp pilus assembly protein TadD